MERKISNWGGCIAAFIAVLLVNYLSNALPLNGQTPKDVSDNFPTLFTPASFTFAIWGVIYLALALFVVYQALPAQRKNPLLASVSRIFILNCIANICWIFCWHYNLMWLSLLVMLVILITLIKIYNRLGIANSPATFAQHVFLFLPFSLYLGWISVATLANVSVLQVAMGWENLGLSEVNWTLLKLAIAAVVAVVMILRRGDIFFGLVIVWAANGIMSKQVETPEVFGAAGMVGATVILLVAFEAIRQLLGNSSAPK